VRPVASARWLLAASLALSPMALAEPDGTIVAFGDSITKGRPDPWPEGLETRLRQRFPHAEFTVINAGIPGNRLLHDGDSAGNPSGLSRFAHDALDPDGVKFVVLLEGINDIGGSDVARTPADIITAADLIAAESTLIARAHERHIKIFGGTLTPFQGAGYASPAGEAIRQSVNRWIRTEAGFDAVIDFDAALRDPAEPGRLRPDYDSGDHLHPTSAGEGAMAAAIDPGLFP
jgi:lysophospholipase L1-like esterase